MVIRQQGRNKKGRNKMNDKKVTIEIDAKIAKEFADYLWNWYAYDPIEYDDENFRTTAQVVWQILDQLKEEN